MASNKKLQLAAAKFRKENPFLHTVYTQMLYFMANYINRSGNTEVTVKNKNGEFYATANF